MGKEAKPGITGSGYDFYFVPSHHHPAEKLKEIKVYTGVFMCSHLPAGLAELLDVDGTTECDDEDRERV